jgi:peptidoglycan/xylan/chitin deacetylase (PgdA/CDA1 family)
LKISAVFHCLALALPLLLLSSCKTPEEVAIEERGEVYAAGEDQKKQVKDYKKTQPAPTSTSGAPGWNPPSNLASGGVGSSTSYSRVSTSQKIVALTFDDGPHPSNTPRLLDILKKRNVKATFYVVGTNARRYPAILRRMVAEGHEIGNHTLSHGYLTKMSRDQIRKDLSQSHQIIVEATGVPPKTIRPPYGAITSDLKSWIKSEYGYPSIMWSVDPEDWKRPGSSVVSRRLVSGASPGGILLVHDIHAPTIDAVPSAVDQLLAKGYRFVTVTQLIAAGGS